MTTEEERKNPELNNKAKDVVDWLKKEEEKQQQHSFIRGDFLGGRSGSSTGSGGGGSGGRSSEDGSGSDCGKTPSFKSYIPNIDVEVPKEEETTGTEDAEASATTEEEATGPTVPTAVEDNGNASPNSNTRPELNDNAKVTASDNSTGGAGVKTGSRLADIKNPDVGEATLRRKLTKGGPRVTRNITEEEVIAQMLSELTVTFKSIFAL
jgi:hypothetical protein